METYITPKSFTASRVERVATGFAFTEGPVWSDQRDALLFTDIPNSRIHLLTRDGELSIFREPSDMANGLSFGPDGRLVACEHATSRVTATSRDGEIQVLAQSYEGKQLNSPNDVVVRSDGRIYFTDPLYGRSAPVGIDRDPELDFQGVYMVGPGGGEPTLLSRDFVAPNGLCFSPDESLLYVNDSERHNIMVFSVLSDGTLDEGSVYFAQDGDPSTGVPDGMKVDSSGAVLCSGPGGIWRTTPHGDLIEILAVPEVVANFGFGGPERDLLYIAASTSLYRVDVAVPGLVAAAIASTETPKE